MFGPYRGVDLSSLLQRVTQVFSLAAQGCLRTGGDGEFRVYADKTVDPSRAAAGPVARANLGVIPGVALEQELGSEYRCLSSVLALL